MLKLSEFSHNHYPSGVKMLGNFIRRGIWVVDNYSKQDGGGFYVSGSIVLTDTEVRGNVASRHGGGLHVQNGTTKMVRGAVDYNYSEGNGGGLNANNSVTVLDTFFYTNTARQDGGGLLEWSSGVAVELSDAYFLQNRSYGNGGAVWTTGNLIITDTTVVSNTADAGKATVTSGGGVYLSGGSLRVTKSTFRGNVANCATCDSFGGGLFIDTAASAVIRDSLLEKNYAYMGGGVYGVKSGLIIQKSMFKHNDAGYGGAVQAFVVDIQGTDFISNTCGNSGGALGSGGSVNITGSRFLNNTAGFSGGGAIWGSMNLSVVNSLFAGNHADNLASVLELQGNQARTLEHVTIASASLDSQPAIDLPAGTLGITNTILTNFNMGIAMLGGTLNADYNLFYGNTNNVVSIGGILHWGFHNLSGNPLFINPAISDYHLQAGSIAINQGINLGIPTDLDGKPRDAKPDIGAYEYWSYVYQPVVRK